MFEIIKSMRPYFFSLREIEGNISLDIKLPLNWKYDTIVSPYRSIKTKIQDKNDKFNLLSLISTATQEGYDVVIGCANEIITINKEDEEKQRLFKEKVRELQSLFEKESLSKLKDINLLEDYGQEITTGNGMATEGDVERQFGNPISQETDD
jgi:hypothetical protein